ncbi:MAG: Imm50 family immunity protein [Pyrinomonadaceae bacterium]
MEGVEAMNIDEKKIEGVRLLTDIFGRFPSFHDAEVVSLKLDRGNSETLATVELSIHVFEMTSEIVENHYVLKNHTLVTFQFEDVVELELEGFNHQNVLQDLSIVDIRHRQLERIKFEVTIPGLHGLEGKFMCRSIKLISAVPFIPIT